MRSFPEHWVRNMQDINPITNKIADLRERLESLRGYL